MSISENLKHQTNESSINMGSALVSTASSGLPIGNSIADTESSSTYHLRETEIKDPQTCTAILAGPRPRTPYNNGYGDFCFGRLIEREDSDAITGVNPNKFRINNVPFVESGGFVR